LQGVQLKQFSKEEGGNRLAPSSSGSYERLGIVNLFFGSDG
jgi:hypothetical protein